MVFFARYVMRKLQTSGTIIFAKIGAAIALNRRAVTSTNCLIDNNTAGLLPLEGIDAEYAFSFMNTVKLMDYSRATTVPSIRKSDICAIPFPLPPYEEQIRISTRLRELNSIIDKIDSLIEQCEIDYECLLKSILVHNL